MTPRDELGRYRPRTTGSAQRGGGFGRVSGGSTVRGATCVGRPPPAVVERRSATRSRQESRVGVT
ncbi:hypothetical protein ABZ960_21575, partial [Streptomyces pseudovenezuelae]|uniref:hypothetical protein n=1 Tax=Streptomyces pseudovenezuelae TaxID=67350 RepID=UPI0034A37420